MTFFATQGDQQQIKPIVGKCGVTSFPTQNLLKHLLHQCQFLIQFCLHLHRLSHRQSHCPHHTSHLSQYRCYAKRIMQQQFSLTLMFSDQFFFITIRHRDFNMPNARSTTHRRALNFLLNFPCSGVKRPLSGNGFISQLVRGYAREEGQFLLH